MTWYHGGPPIKGRWLLPPSITGAPTAAEVFAGVFGASVREAGLEPDRARPDRVFLTTAKQLARAHAFMLATTGRAPYGVLYECWPVTCEPDPDHEEDFPGVCVQEPFATIVRVIEQPVEMTSAALQRVLMRYTTPLPGYTKQDLIDQGDELVARLVAGEDVRPQFAPRPT